MKIGTTDIKDMFLGTAEVKKIFSGTTLLYEKIEGATYEDYARTLYLAWGKSNQFAAAWEHSLTVDLLAIGKAQYPNGETEGVIIPQGVTSIGQSAFAYWSSNNQPLVIPDSVTSIGNWAFDGWYDNNQPLVIPNSVTSIGTTAFGDWESNNQPLVIPDSVTSISGSAFSYWLSVLYVEMRGETPPTLADSNAFDWQNDAPIYVPHESVTAYKTATQWVNLASRIFSINDK